MGAESYAKVSSGEKAYIEYSDLLQWWTIMYVASLGVQLSSPQYIQLNKVFHVQTRQD